MPEQNELFDKKPLEIALTKEQLNWAFDVIQQSAPLIGTWVSSMPPGDLLIVLAYLVAAFEAQDPDTTIAFEAFRTPFKACYPDILADFLAYNVDYVPMEIEGKKELTFVLPVLEKTVI